MNRVVRAGAHTLVVIGAEAGALALLAVADHSVSEQHEFLSGLLFWLEPVVALAVPAAVVWLLLRADRSQAIAAACCVPLAELLAFGVAAQLAPLYRLVVGAVAVFIVLVLLERPGVRSR